MAGPEAHSVCACRRQPRASGIEAPQALTAGPIALILPKRGTIGAMPQPADIKRPAPRLYLVTPISRTSPLSHAPLAARSRRPTSPRCCCGSARGRARPDQPHQVAAAHRAGNGAALLLDGHAELAARAGADGAHLTGIEAFTAAVGASSRSASPAAAACRPATTRCSPAKRRRLRDVRRARRRAPAVVRGDHRAGRVVGGAVRNSLRRLCRSPERGWPLWPAGADFIAVGDGIWDAPRGAVAASPRWPIS